MDPLSRWLQALRLHSWTGTGWLVGVLALTSASSTARAQCEVAKLTPSDALVGDTFGLAVSLSGDLAVVGSPYRDDPADRSGAAYVFRFNGVDWIQEAKLLAADGAAVDFFGGAAAIDGETIVIGSNRNDEACPAENPDCDSGAVYVFIRAGTSWIQAAKLVAPDASARQLFGKSVSISGDRIAVGTSPLRAGGTPPGAAYVFRREGSIWVLEAQFGPQSPFNEASFGISVSLDDDVLLVGADPAAYVFRRNGTSWIQEARLLASDGGDLALAVAIDAGLAVVASESECAVYIFRFNTDAWEEEAKLAPSDPEPCELFGRAVSVHEEQIVIGRPFDNAVVPPTREQRGAAYLFEKIGGDWIQVLKMIHSDPTGPAGDQLGRRVAIDQNRVLLGAWRQGDREGAAYVFDPVVGLDCNANTVNDDCELETGDSMDCNLNGSLDECDIAAGTSDDCDSNNVPDDCEDCNGNGIGDSCDIAAGTSEDCTGNGIPDECESDCNSNNTADSCDIHSDTSVDCNANTVPDECENYVASSGVAIYWTDNRTNKIQRTKVCETTVEDLVTAGLRAPVGVTLDLMGGKLYWTDTQSYSVGRANLDGSSAHIIVSSSARETFPMDVAVDPEAGKVYWTEHCDEGCTFSSIRRANLDGTSMEILIDTDISIPLGIALDIGAGKMYWSDGRSDSRIYRANTDGSNREVVVDGAAFDRQPWEIELDINAGHIYWAEDRGPVKRANLSDGSNLQTIVTSPHTNGGLGLDLLARKVYWSTHFETGGIYRANLDGTDVELVQDTPIEPHGIALDPQYIPQCIGPASCADPIAGVTGDNQCTDNLCDSNQICQNPPIADWDQANVCCDPTDASFTAIDDGIACTEDSCSLDGLGVGLGVAQHVALAEGTDCDDGNACTYDDKCNEAAGDCTGSDINIIDCDDDATCDALVTGTYCRDGACQCLHPLGRTANQFGIPGGSDMNRAGGFAMPASAVAGGEGEEVVIRVKLRRLYIDKDEDPANGCPVGPDFSSFENQVRYLGPPSAFDDNAATAPQFVAAELQCAPFYRDWSPAALTAAFGAGVDTSTIYYYGTEVVPCSIYEAQQATQVCIDEFASEDCFSTALEIRTAMWGDVWPPFGVINFTDIGKVVDSFKSMPFVTGNPPDGAPRKVQGMLRGNSASLVSAINFTDIGNVVNAFKTIAYAEDGPTACP